MSTLTKFDKAVFIGLACIIFFYLGNRIYIYHSCEKTNGVVTEAYTRKVPGGEMGGTMPITVVRFEVDGTVYEIEDYMRGYFREQKLGTEVVVLYKKEDPKKSRVYDMFSFWIPINNMLILVVSGFIWVGLLDVIRGGLEENRKRIDDAAQDTSDLKW